MRKLLITTLSLVAMAVQAQNVTQGTGAGAALTTGERNVLIGSNAGSNVTTGFDATVIGHETATDAGGGAYDLTVVGHQAAKVHRHDAVFVGYLTGETATFGQTVALGNYAGRYLTGGHKNTLIGYQAGQHIAEGDNNTAVGRNTISNRSGAFYNVAIGNIAGSFFGHPNYPDEVANNRYGIFNTAVGNAAGTDITSSVGNTCIGDNACTHTSVADLITGIGYQAGKGNNRDNITTNANRNVYFGAYAGYTNRTGEDNVFLGFNADNADLSIDIATEAAWANYSSDWDPELSAGNPYFGKSNDQVTVVGVRSKVTANQGVSLGHWAKVHGVGSIAVGSNALTNHANAVAIGYGASSQQDNGIVLGNASTTEVSSVNNGTTQLGNAQRRFTTVATQNLSVVAPVNTAAVVGMTANGGQTDAEKWQLAANLDSSFSINNQTTGTQQAVLQVASNADVTLSGTLTLSSDARLKQHVQPLDNALHLVEALEGKHYYWRPELQKDPSEQLGLIAQEVEEVLPELVTEDDTGIKSVNYLGLIPVLVKAYQEQQQLIAEQDKRQADLTAKAQSLLSNAGGQ